MYFFFKMRRLECTFLKMSLVLYLLEILSLLIDGIFFTLCSDHYVHKPYKAPSPKSQRHIISFLTLALEGGVRVCNSDPPRALVRFI